MILGSKLEKKIDFYNDVERHSATWIWPGENVLCLTDSKETTAVLSVRLWTLCTV